MEEENKTGVDTENGQDAAAYRPEGPTVRFSYQMRMKDQMGFLARFAFGGLNGLAFWLVLLLLVWRIISGFSTDPASTKCLLFFGAFILIVLMPGSLYFRAFTQCRLAKLNQLVSTYEISNAGIFVTQETEHRLFTWDEIIRVDKKKKVTYLYVFKNSAFICPRDILGDGDMETLNALADANWKPAGKRN